LRRPIPSARPRISTNGPGEDLERIDVALIREATKQIDMAAYVLTDRAVIEALRQTAARGVNVRIWRDASEAVRVNEFDVEAQLGERVLSFSAKSGGSLGFGIEKCRFLAEMKLNDMSLVPFARRMSN
jgi:PLD-like domain